MKGVFELRSAADLYEKLKMDFDVFRENQNDSSAAYNFFVTAWHLLEWVYPGNSNTQQVVRNSNVILQICEHLAVGAKHFQPTNKKHQSVSNSGVSRFWEKGYWAKGTAWGQV